MERLGLRVHGTWEDWVMMLGGLIIAISPWLAGRTMIDVAAVNCGIAGVLLIIVSGLELSRLHRWQEIAALVIGLWMIASPSLLNYAGVEPLANWHQVLGSLVALVGLFEIWQDWGLTDNELAHHGR